MRILTHFHRLRHHEAQHVPHLPNVLHTAYIVFLNHINHKPRQPPINDKRQNEMSLLTLPAELRHEIYSHLIPLESNYWLFRDGFITKLSHKPPPNALLRVCRFLNNDALAYYYSIATIRITPSAHGHVWQYSLYDIPDIRRVSKVEVEMKWWGDGAFERPEDDIWVWLYHKAHKLEALRMLNKEAHCLRQVVVTVYWHNKPDLEWELVQERLDELRELKSGVVLVAGKVTRRGSRDEGMQKKLEEFVRKLNAERA